MVDPNPSLRVARRTLPCLDVITDANRRAVLKKGVRVLRLWILF
jgi:hypothetical protein